MKLRKNTKTIPMGEYLAAQGMTKKDLAEKVGLIPSVVSYAAKMEREGKDVRVAIEKGQPMCLVEYRQDYRVFGQHPAGRPRGKADAN